uniref:Glycosyltransferase family 92 protein n=1 Tax=Parastrongyloides trichosuri TaxID=131310 RepID=A0A0N4Z9D5_PARTI
MGNILYFIFTIWKSKLSLLLLISLALFYKLTIYFSRDHSIKYYVSLDNVKTDLYLGNFYETFQNSLEPIEYLRNIRMGKMVSKNEQNIITSYKYSYFCSSKYILNNKSKKNQWNFNPPFYIISSYYDDRESEYFSNNSVIQIIASAYNSTYIHENKYFCHIFSSRSKRYLYSSPVMVRTLWNRAWDPRVSFYTSFLLTCPVITNSDIMYNLAGLYCPPKNISLNVIQNPKLKEDSDIKITACVKGLDFEQDISLKLLEWIEWQKQFGINHVTMYIYDVNERAQRVLDYFVGTGFLTLIPITLPGHQPNEPNTRRSFIKGNKQQKRRNELISYNDCFYRHSKDSDYVLIIDIDEIIVPLEHNTYQEMLLSIKDYKYTSFMVQNVFKFTSNVTTDNILPFSSHFYRSTISQGKEAYAKSFIRTKYASSVFTHFALHKQTNDSKKFYVPLQTAIKLHFKENCPEESMFECDRLIESSTKDDLLSSIAPNLRNKIKKIAISLNLIN